MNKINIGLIGYGNVGSGVVKLLQKKRKYIKAKHHVEFVLKTICDRSIKKKKIARGLKNVRLTASIEETIADPDLHVIIELIGGLHPAKDIILQSLKKNKHVVTANKEVIAHFGQLLFEEAHRQGQNIYFESAVMAGVPIIKLLSEGIAGNGYKEIYGIINGTCNYILSAMSQNEWSFEQAVKEAQKRGFAEADPTLDINGMDSTHKLAILTALAFNKFIKPNQIHTEGITQISHHDIEYAESLNLTIKLLAIAKQINGEIEARVHPTFIPKEHPLGSINGVYNAALLSADPLGDVLLSGEGAGQFAAASGVVSDLINLASRQGSDAHQLLSNLYIESPDVKLRKIDEVETRFYLRFKAPDQPGTLAKISGVLGRHGIGINSVTQKAHEERTASVPVIILTDDAKEKDVRKALAEIAKKNIIKAAPVAIRMENL